MPQQSTESRTEATSQSAPSLPEKTLDLSRRWLRNSSIEISGHEIGHAQDAARLLPRGTEVLIPWLPDSTPTQMVRAAATLRDAGLCPVPHIAARRMASAAQTKALFQDLVKNAGVHSVLLIAGDIERPAGPFDSALSLLRTGQAESAGIRSIGIAGYPEGHPLIEAAVLQQHLIQKLECLRTRGLHGFVVTQFCFEAQAVLRWLAALRNDGIAAPVRIGVAGPTRLRKLLAMGLRCGIGNSLRALKGKAGAINALLSTHGPEELIAELARGEALAPSVADLSLHLFAFGGAEVTARWLAQSNAEAETPRPG
jgi:methylenetetrahydrofolate reductase (NADPH)